jgi:hypothetical protein
MLFGRLSASQTCTLAHWASQAGVVEAKAFALRPDACSGHASRKLKQVLGHTSCKELYEAAVPGHARHDLDRTAHSTPFLPLHEQIARYLGDPRDTIARLQEKIDAEDLPPAYTEHKV